MDRYAYNHALEEWQESEGAYLRQLRAIVSCWLYWSITKQDDARIDGNNDTRYWGFDGRWFDAQGTNEALVQLGLIEASESNDHGDHDTSKIKPTTRGIFAALTGEVPPDE